MTTFSIKYSRLAICVLMVSTIPGLAAPSTRITQCASAPEDIICLAGRGRIYDSTLNLTEVMWVGPENRHVYLGSPSIAETPSGALLVSHDFFGPHVNVDGNRAGPDYTLNTTVQVLRNADGRGGAEPGGWRYAGSVAGMYWANVFPFEDGAMYLLGVDGNDNAAARNIVIARSTDEGTSWTTPSILFPAGTPAGGGAFRSYHCAPTPTLHLPEDGRLYRAFETYAHYAGALVISTRDAVNASTDLLDPATWRMSNLVEFKAPAAWGPPSTGGWGWQEGNAVEAPDGGVYNMLRIDGQTAKTHNKAAVLHLDPGSNALALKAFIDFPSTESKFVVRRHPASGTYYTLSNNVTAKAGKSTSTVYARNTLVLATSDDALSWRVCGPALLADDTGLSFADSARYTGFHYVSWVFRGADMLYAVRTGYRGSDTYHNANRVTYKVVEGFAARCAA